MACCTLFNVVVVVEAFARRAITKIDELSQIVSISSEPQSKETENTFRLATVKVCDPYGVYVMVELL